MPPQDGRSRAGGFFREPPLACVVPGVGAAAFQSLRPFAGPILERYIPVWGLGRGAILERLIGFIERGLAPLSNGLPIEGVVVLSAIVIVSWLIVSLAYDLAVHVIGLGAKTLYEIAAGDTKEREVKIHYTLLIEKLKGAKTGKPLVVSNGQKRFRLTLQRKTADGQTKIELPRDVYEAFAADKTKDTASVDLIIRPMSPYTPSNLWNHPDQATQIGVRLTVAFTIISTFAQAVIEAFKSVPSQ